MKTHEIAQYTYEMLSVLQATPSNTKKIAPVNRITEIGLLRMWKKGTCKLSDEIVIEFEFKFGTHSTVPTFGGGIGSLLWCPSLVNQQTRHRHTHMLYSTGAALESAQGCNRVNYGSLFNYGSL
jgi:hypothetical protein